MGVNFSLAVCVCWNFFLVKDVFAKSQQREQRELLWGAAEAWRSEQRSSDRHLSFLHFTSSRCPCTQPTQPAVSGGHMCVSVRVPAYVCVCACVCPGPRYAALIKPTAKRKTRPAASCNDPEYTYGCFGENKWAENGIHKHSWYREGRGGETLNSSRAAASQTIPLSHEEGRFFFSLFYRFLASVSVSAVVYLQRSCVILPAKHLRIVVDGDVGCDAVVVGAKVAVWSTKPLIKAVLQRKVLWPVAQMPAVTNKQHTHCQINVTKGWRCSSLLTHMHTSLHFTDTSAYLFGFLAAVNTLRLSLVSIHFSTVCNSCLKQSGNPSLWASSHLFYQGDFFRKGIAHNCSTSEQKLKADNVHVINYPSQTSSKAVHKPICMNPWMLQGHKHMHSKGNNYCLLWKMIFIICISVKSYKCALVL